jgi:hypothetical protein
MSVLSKDARTHLGSVQSLDYLLKSELHRWNLTFVSDTVFNFFLLECRAYNFSVKKGKTIRHDSDNQNIIENVSSFLKSHDDTFVRSESNTSIFVTRRCANLLLQPLNHTIKDIPQELGSRNCRLKGFLQLWFVAMICLKVSSTPVANKPLCFQNTAPPCWPLIFRKAKSKRWSSTRLALSYKMIRALRSCKQWRAILTAAYSIH